MNRRRGENLTKKQDQVISIDNIVSEIQRENSDLEMSHFNTETLEELYIENQTSDVQEIYLAPQSHQPFSEGLPNIIFVVGSVTEPVKIMDLTPGECVKILPVSNTHTLTFFLFL